MVTLRINFFLTQVCSTLPYNVRDRYDNQKRVFTKTLDLREMNY